MIVFNFFKGRFFGCAKLLAINATILERTARRNIKRAGNLSRQNFYVLIFFAFGGENSLQKCTRVRVTRSAQLVAVNFFHKVAQIHNRNSVTEHADQRKVVANENVSYSFFALKFDEQFNNRVLNGNIES